MSAFRYSQRELTTQINDRIQGEGLALCTLADHHGVHELGCHFVLRRGTQEIVALHTDLIAFANSLGLVEFPAELHA
jgi:hypothetical protein